MVRLVKADSDSGDSGDNKPAKREETPKPAPAASTPRRHRRWWKLPLLAVFCLAFLSGGWFSYKIASATGKIFTENSTGGSPVLQGKKLNGENSRINILLIGIGGENHDGGTLADTIQVVSIDAKNKQAAMLSIPRDLYVQVPGDSFTKVKINEVHAIGEDRDGDGKGPPLLKETVQDILDVPIHYFVRVDFAGFTQLVDTIGGVDINVAERLYDPYYPKGYGYQVLNVQPGLQHMDGDLALKYARSRETTDDFDRSRRQQEVTVAVRDKALSLQYLTNPAKISQFISILGDHVKTDLSLSEVQKLAGIVKDIPQGSVTSRVIDNTPNTGLLYDSTGPGGAYILLPRAGDYTDIREFANQLFAASEIQAEHAQIGVQNASGRSGLARTEADALLGYGYAVPSVTNAPQLSNESIIYDYTNGAKPFTVSYLEKRYKARVVKAQAPAPGIDIQVVIGTNYLNQ